VKPVAAAYNGVRARVGELTGTLDETASWTPVPPCPRWSVHDVVAHLVGVVEDALAGRLDGVATDPWTQAQVEARKDQSIPEMLASWSAAAPPFEGLLDDIGPVGRQAVLDAVTHEHDIRTALGESAARQSDAVIIGYEFGAPVFLEDAEGHGARIRLEGFGVQAFGPIDAPLRLQGSPFDLMRALTGRRSLEQIRAMAWSGECEPVLDVFTWGPFQPSGVGIDE
jgi:uncharacterized protein (TIGR03083 family)